jgi:hypothetical protein
VAALVVASVVAGCSDVGDDAAPNPPAVVGDDGTIDQALDSGTSSDASVEAVQEGAGGPSAADDAPGPDAPAAEASEGETSEDATASSDGAEDVGLATSAVESGADSTAVQGGDGEADAPDAPVLEPAPEASVADGAVREAGDDATTHDGGGDVVEAGVPEAAVVDASDAAPDAAVDASAADASEGGGSLVPCTVAGQQGCVQCQGNLTGTGANGGLCSQTDALFVSYDIRKGFATAPGPDPDDSCYACLVNGGALDDTETPDVGLECEDLTGSFTAGDGFTGSAVDICLATLGCVLEQDCALGAAGGVSNCYCGPGGGTPSVCLSHGSATNGACKTQEADGFLGQPNDAVTILDNYNNLSQPSGKANQFFVFANGTCDQCLQ